VLSCIYDRFHEFELSHAFYINITMDFLVSYLCAQSSRVFGLEL
jgi:hypothetical protein